MTDYGIKLVGEIDWDTKLYRYMSLAQFISFVEGKKINLTNIGKWPDKWEAALNKLPIVAENGEVNYPLYDLYQEMYGQCWSLNSESDAMWRIYSPKKQGILIGTTTEKFRKIDKLSYGVLGKVKYYSDIKEVLKYLGDNHGLSGGLVKRTAFEYENEVRLLTLRKFINDSDKEGPYINIPLEPTDFIEDIIIDPRASQWLVEAITSYCKRVGFKFIPKQSELYCANVFEHTKVAVKLSDTHIIN
ncbi:MAG: DUF2971 domain-containing protein [Bacillota bacterium]|nr:DUF2971 domain-containing protein [Bacillota bacterium]